MLKRINSGVNANAVAVVLDKAVFLIGRNINADLILLDKQISRKHCCIFNRNNEYSIQIMSSSGVGINGKQVDTGNEVALKDKDIVSLTDAVQYQFHVSNAKHADSKKMPSASSSRPAAQFKVWTDADEDAFQLKKILREEWSLLTADRDREKAMADKLRLEVQVAHGALKSHEERISELQAALKTATERHRKLEEVTETETQCAICFEIVVCATTLGCSHTFCETCITEWRNKSPNCPSCRSKIRRMTRCKMLDLYITKVSDTLGDGFKERRQQVLTERNMDSQCQTKRPCLNNGVMPRNEPGPDAIIDLTTN